MNGSQPQYNAEYVEIQTALTHIRTRLETIEQSIRHIHQQIGELSASINQNRIDIASVKATAAVFGGLAGTMIGFVTRLF